MANLFDSHKHKNAIDTATVHDVSVGRQRGRVIFLGLVYAFGGEKKVAEETFDE